MPIIYGHVCTEILGKHVKHFEFISQVYNLEGIEWRETFLSTFLNCCIFYSANLLLYNKHQFAIPCKYLINWHLTELI